jgi:ABC-2 type transport system ATP-binding protein
MLRANVTMRGVPNRQVVTIERVAKRYGGDKQAVTALADVSFEVKAGTIFGLLGPNGAGKSTLLRILTTLVHPTSGCVRLFGAPLGPRPLRRVGAFIEAPAFYPYLTATETLEMLALASTAKGMSTAALLEKVGLVEAARRKVATFSLGMKQRLAIAAALVGDPELVILDEPTNGMDPAGIQDIRGLIRDLSAREGRTVMLSSHLLDEVQRVCDHVVILDRGSVAAQGRMADLVGGSERLRIEARPLDLVLELLGRRGAREGEFVMANVSRADAPALAAALVDAGAELLEMRWIQRDLEAVFFAETKR